MILKPRDVIAITKLDAAKRQLRTALTLWFTDGDPVSVHTLACAAYEIVHVVSKRRGRSTELLFDTLEIKDEHRSEYNIWLKGPANFFKHANRDTDDALRFQPLLTDLFLLFTIAGFKLLDEPLGDEESAFLAWLGYHRPDLLTERGREAYTNSVPVDQLEHIRAIPKRNFFETFKVLRQNVAGA